MPFHIESSCTCCGCGVGFYNCNNEKIILLCEECDAVWLSPFKLSSPENPIFFVDSSTGYFNKENCKVGGDNSKWALYEEIPAEWRSIVINSPEAGVNNESTEDFEEFSKKLGF